MRLNFDSLKKRSEISIINSVTNRKFKIKSYYFEKTLDYVNSQYSQSSIYRNALYR